MLRNTNINNFLKEEFFIALGENKTLNYLNIDNTSYMSTTNLIFLGKSSAMNFRKNGNLKYLSLANSVQNWAGLKSFFDSFQISDHSHEMWYGDKKVAKEMSKEQLENKFSFGLQYLNLGNCILTGNMFKHKELSKRKDPHWPLFMKVFTQETLETINMSVCQMQKNDIELFNFSLHQNPFGVSRVRVLNLSRNNLTKEGAKTLA